VDEGLAAADRLSAAAAAYKDDTEKLQTLQNPAELKAYQEGINHSLGQVEAALKAGKLAPEQAALQLNRLKDAGTAAAQAAALGLTGQVLKVDTLRDELNAAQPGTPLYDAGIKSLTENNPKLLAELQAKYQQEPQGVLAGIEKVWNSLDDPALAGGWGKTWSWVALLSVCWEPSTVCSVRAGWPTCFPCWAAWAWPRHRCSQAVVVPRATR
jgi:hypothetical protein